MGECCNIDGTDRGFDVLFCQIFSIYLFQLLKKRVSLLLSPEISETLIFLNFFSGRKLDSEKVVFARFCFAQAKRACALRRATSETAFKMLYRDRRMDREARLRVNQGEAEGVDFRPRLKLNPQICP